MLLPPLLLLPKPISVKIRNLSMKR
jgi:hypothetical protein